MQSNIFANHFGKRTFFPLCHRATLNAAVLFPLTSQRASQRAIAGLPSNVRLHEGDSDCRLVYTP